MSEEQFADALDGIVNGRFPASSDPLVSFARQMYEREGERMPGDRRTVIWKQLMAMHPHDTLTTGGAGPLSQPTLTDPIATNPWVKSGFRPGPKRTRLGAINNGFQVSITALAVVAIVIAAFAAFPIIRSDGGPDITPTAFAAAPTTSVDTFAATGATPGTPTPPEQATPWATWWPNEPAPINPGPARPEGSPGPFTPPAMPPILPMPGVIPPPPTPSPPPTPR